MANASQIARLGVRWALFDQMPLVFTSSAGVTAGNGLTTAKSTLLIHIGIKAAGVPRAEMSPAALRSPDRTAGGTWN